MADDDPPPPHGDSVDVYRLSIGESERLRNEKSRDEATGEDSSSSTMMEQAEEVQRPSGVEPDESGDCASALAVPRKSDEASCLETGPLSGKTSHPPDEDGKRDAHVKEDATALQELKEEVASIRATVECSTQDAEDDVLRQLRAWGHRTARGDRPPTTPTTARLIPMAAPSGQVPPAVNEDDAPLLCVISFDDGVYRGQVTRCPVDTALASAAASDGATDLVTERFVPHGWGIATSFKGLRRVGQWRDGEQVGVGTLQSAVFLYDGEWEPLSGPSGYGIGTFAFGATFVGCWLNGKPYGLGRLQSFETNSFQHGWFYGTRCLQPTTIANQEELHAQSMQQHLPPRRFDEHPQRGLFLVGQILEDARLWSLRLALEQWRRVACGHAMELARRRRAETMTAWVQAHAAEQDAIAWHTYTEIQAYRARMSSLLDDVEAGRQKHTRVERIREFHSNKLRSAIFQRDLARRCVIAQQESIALMENELAEVATLLEEAHQAQNECKQLAAQQQDVKRQIENATVKINALRQQIRRRETGDDVQQQHTQDHPRKDLQTPATPSYAKAIHGPRRVRLTHAIGDADDGLPFVCDVPGCSCGIPRVLQEWISQGSAGHLESCLAVLTCQQQQERLMVLYYLAGRVNSEEYAICERLLDILQVTMPDIQVDKTPYHQTKWPDEAAKIATTNGFRVPTAAQMVVCDVIIWSETRRLVSTDADAFSSFVQQYYGVQLDLNESELSLYVKANIDEMKKLQREQEQAARAAAKASS